jgi:uncharacterized protein YyaL (SSP411 family)
MEINLIKESLIKNRENLSQNTIKTYVSVLNSLYKKLDGKDNLEFFKKHTNEIIESSNEITASLSKISEYKPEINLDGNFDISKLQESAFNFYAKNYDNENGGFGNKPKFPSPHNLVFLLNYYQKTGNKESKNIALNTLDMIQMGGINDHIGGGYHRYSTDEKWLVPHFEKMLYDNALLISAFSKAFLITQNPQYQIYAKDIIQYLISDMMLENMMFASARDADSEGVENHWQTEHS